MDIGRAVIVPVIDSEEGEGEVRGGSRGGGTVGGRDSRGGEESNMRGGRSGSQGSVGTTATRARGGVASAVSIMGWNGFSEMAWKRRHANDPAMMRELKRYQKLMLLTLLPAITGSGEGDQSNYQAQASYYRESESPSEQNSPRQDDSPSDMTKIGDDDDDDGDHLPRPEPKDAIVGLMQKDQSPRYENPWVRRTSHPSSSSSNEATHLPMTVYNPLNMSPKRKGRRKSRDDALRKRRNRSRDMALDDARDVAEVGSGFEGSPAGGSSLSDTGGGAGGDLDLLTLAALYLESRHRVFGKEWHYRPESLSNNKPTGQVGSTGISRPRRLTPLSSNTKTPVAKVNNSGLDYHNSGVIPAPAGLHLSVNYTQNLDLDESSYIAERARALKPRLRRLNSLDDMVQATSPLGSPHRSIYRATSAPDLSQSAQARHLHSLLKSDSKTSLDSISPPPVTPARANTPTGVNHSAALARPQIVGGSLATNSALSRSLSSSRGATTTGPKETKKNRAMSEGSRNALLQPPPWGALPPDYKELDLPTASPPSAMGEVQRKNGRIHLEPLTIRKTSY